MYLGEKTKDGFKKSDKKRKNEIRRPNKCTILVRLLFDGTRYVQDERYAAGAGMRTTAGMQEVEPRRSSCRGAARVSFARP